MTGVIPKAIEQITEKDLDALVADGVSERKTLDYKQQLPDPNDAGKRELLADVSSFANTAGGDLLFGVTESAGLPTGLPGVQIADTDQEILRIDNIIRTGLDPRIRQATVAVPLANGCYVLIVRAEQSWYGPHRVIFKGGSRFWGRTSKGKYELDVTELRNAFLFANTVTGKIASFRAERIIALENGQSLVPLADGPKLVMHCIPIESFAAKPQYNIFAFQAPGRFSPMYWNGLGGWGPRINFEGVICVAAGEPCSAYTQIYRNGVIEAVRAEILSSLQVPGIIPSFPYEHALIEYFPECLKVLKGLGCSAPILVGISLIGVRGMKLAVDRMISRSGGTAIDRDVLVLPEIMVEDLSASAGPLLKPVLDLVWNACGHQASPNFDAFGNWKPMR